MLFAYLDEFGHIGPYFSRTHPQYNTSPVFGLAGIILPESSVRTFSSFFLSRKKELLGSDIERSGKPAFAWEKKGTNLYTAKSILKYPEIRQTTFRMLNKIKAAGGQVFFYGREKVAGRTDVNSTGLYKTVLSHAIRKIDAAAAQRQQNFVIVIDQHSARKELLVTATKTMYGDKPARWLASPPFEVESYLNQNMQAADWIATVVGRIAAYAVAPADFSEYEPYQTYFRERIEAVAPYSTVMRRRQPPQPSVHPDATSMAIAMADALSRNSDTVEVTVEKATVKIQKNLSE